MHYTRVGQGTQAHTHKHTHAHCQHALSASKHGMRTRCTAVKHSPHTPCTSVKEAENQVEAYKYLIETTQRVYSVALVSAAQHKSTKTTACSSAHVFACWAAEGRSALVFLIFSQWLGLDGLYALHGRLTLARLLQQRFQH